MLKGKKLIAVVLVLVVVAGAAYEKMHGKAKGIERVKGTLYELPKSFLLNLRGDHYVKVMVALELAPGQSDGTKGASAPTAEEGPGTLPEEPLVRAIVTNAITGRPGAALVDERGRHRIERQILSEIRSQTDVKTVKVLFPEITVQ